MNFVSSSWLIIFGIIIFKYVFINTITSTAVKLGQYCYFNIFVSLVWIKHIDLKFNEADKNFTQDYYPLFTEAKIKSPRRILKRSTSIKPSYAQKAWGKFTQFA